jgi:hypothetical protein
MELALFILFHCIAKRWESVFGTQEELLEKTNKKLKLIVDT